MKLSSRPAARAALLTCALCCALSTAGAAAAPAQAPAASAARQDGTPRERRARAYAKLLEGQRHFAGGRAGGLTVEAIKRAQQAFQDATTLDPTLAEAHTALGEIAFFYLQDFQKAESAAATAVRVDPDNLGARRLLARVYSVKSSFAEGTLDREMAERAIAELREVVRLSPNDPEGWGLLGELQLAAGREKEAAEAFKKLSTLTPTLEGRFYQVVTKGRELTPDAAYARLAEIHLRAGRANEAVAALRQSLALEPENERYIEMLGEALEAGGGADQGVIAELRRLVRLNPKNAVAVGMLARAQARAGRTDDAVLTLREGIASRPGADREMLSLQLQLAQTFADALRYKDAVSVHEDLLRARNIGDAPLTADRDKRFAALILGTIIDMHRQAGQSAEAFAAVERMRRLLGVGDPAPDIQNINLLRAEGKRAEALAAIRDARKRHPEDLPLLRLEAYTLTDLGRVEEALGLIRARLRGVPEDYNEYVVIASLLINAGRGGEAVEAARKAVELAPADEPERAAEALVLLSSAQERAGDLKGSEESLRRILAKDPNNATALNNLGYFLTERNERLPEALQMIRRAVSAEPTNASFLDSLGWVHFKLGQLEDAERYLRDAARRNPASAAVQEHLGDLLQRLGKTEQARAAWQKALSLSAEASDTSRIKAKLSGLMNK